MSSQISTFVRLHIKGKRLRVYLKCGLGFGTSLNAGGGLKENKSYCGLISGLKFMRSSCRSECKIESRCEELISSMVTSRLGRAGVFVQKPLL